MYVFVTELLPFDGDGNFDTENNVENKELSWDGIEVSP